jgi:predicted RNA binding protein YcfA (HicA-like mRNA interferase family)
MKALAAAGFERKRQEGSHVILRRNEPFAQVVVPDHQELDRGTLRAIIRQAGLSVEDVYTVVVNDVRTLPCPVS